MSEKLIKKNQVIIKKLQQLFLDFNDIFILECFSNSEDKQYFSMFKIPSLEHFNLSSRYQYLKKEGFLVEDPNNTEEIIISVKSKELLGELNSDDKPGIGGESFTITLSNNWAGKVSLTDDDKFEEWWKTYPTSTSWNSDDKKTKFSGSRALKNLKKADAKKRYLKLLNQGLVHEELVGGLKYEIKLKKLDSIKKGENQMDYFKGMESYFNQERYLLYIDSFKEYPDFINDNKMNSLNSKPKNVTDI